MEFIKDFEESKNIFSKKINASKYIEGTKIIKEKKGVDDICELIIGKNELFYQSCNENEKGKLIIDKKLEIASMIPILDKYIKKFNCSLIQTGLQNEYYKIHCIIHNEETNEYYQTTIKEYEPIYCIYKNNSWYLKETPFDKDILFSDIHKLESVLIMDINTIYINKPYLSSISKYKMKELESIAKDHEIDLYQGKKKKLKKELFDEINLKIYKQHI